MIFGLRLFILLAVMGGFIAFLGDRLGSKVGKKKLSLFGLRPYYTSVLMTILSGIVIALLTMGIITVSSESARTALFGMDKLRAEMKTMTAALEERNKQVKELDEKIAATNKEKEEAASRLDNVQKSYQEAERALAGTRQQVGELESTRNTLQGEVKELNETTERLREGIVVMRQGDVAFRSGEVLFAAVLRGGLPETQNNAQFETFMAAANLRVLGLMGISDEKQLALIVPESMVKQAKEAMTKYEGDVYVRICAAGNTIAGERVLSTIEMIPNKKVYSKGQQILSQKVTVNVNTVQPDQALMAFLQECNKNAIVAGVLPDPVTGKVGRADAAELENASKEIRKLGGRVEIIGTAMRDTFVSGPVFLHVEVRRSR